MTELTADEFEIEYADKNNVTVEWLRDKGQVVVACDCDYEGCRGWSMTQRHLLEDE